MEDQKSILAQRIIDRMAALKMNQSELAEKTGITRAGISQILNSPRMPTVPVLRKIASVLGKSTSYLMGVSEGDEVEEAIKENPDQLAFFRNYQNLKPEDREMLEKIMENFKQKKDHK